jgi:SOS-response transcriptional repressor LexA
MGRQQIISGKISGFSARLIGIMEDRNFQIDDLAEKMGVSAGAIGNWRSGGGITTKNAHALAKVLGVPFRFLMHGETEEAHAPTSGGQAFILRSEDPVPYRTSKEPPFRPIPVVSWAHAGEIDQEGNYGDLANQIDEYVSSDCRDPNSYAVIVENDSMEPELRAGDRVVLLPNTEARNGDIVVCRLAESGGTMIKRFRRTGPEGATVRLESANEIYKVQTHPNTAFRFIHPVYELHRRIRR